MSACICGHTTAEHDSLTRKCQKCPCFRYRLVVSDEYVANAIRDFDHLCNQLIVLHYWPSMTTRIQ